MTAPTTVAELMEKAKEAGHDSLGIANDPEADLIFKKLNIQRLLKTLKVCGGAVEVWDQTLGCPECQMELWNYPGCKEAGIDYKEYERRFFLIHPFMFEDCHDPGDEDPKAHEREEAPIGGWIASYNRYHYGNNLALWDK